MRQPSSIGELKMDTMLYYEAMVAKLAVERKQPSKLSAFVTGLKQRIQKK